METLPKNQNEQQSPFFILSFIYSRQFLTTDRWLTSRAMKDQKEQERATKRNEKQQRAAETRTGIMIEKPTHAITNQNEQQSERNYKWKPGLNLQMNWTGVNDYCEI